MLRDKRKKEDNQTFRLVDFLKCKSFNNKVKIKNNKKEVKIWLNP